MKKRDCIRLSLLCSTIVLAGVVSAANDPSGGQCDVLGHPSQLYPICIQAWSAKNRVELLTAVEASATAVAVAQAQLEEAIATYAALSNGETIPGFTLPCPCEGEVLSTPYDNVIWSSAFTTRLCVPSEDGLTLVNPDDPNSPELLWAYTHPFTGTTACVIAGQVEQHAITVTPAQLTACLASLRRIATEDGITCP